MPNGTPTIPESITVHLGRPEQNARNVTLPFLEYVANVASSEIYPPGPKMPFAPICTRRYPLP